MREGGIVYQLDNLPKQITAEKEDQIILQLPDYSSAGYRWHIEQVPGETIEILSRKLQKTDEVIGMGEFHICFSVRNNGCLRLYLKRDWEDIFYYDTTLVIQCKEE